MYITLVVKLIVNYINAKSKWIGDWVEPDQELHYCNPGSRRPLQSYQIVDVNEGSYLQTRVTII